MTSTATRDTPHILLVDENPQDLALIQESCADCSLPAVFHIAHDGEEALACMNRLSQAGARPDLIVLDIILPKQDGFHVLRELKRQASSRPTPVLVLTGSCDMRHVDRSFRLGASDYLYKPVVYGDSRVVAEHIAELLHLTTGVVPPLPTQATQPLHGMATSQSSSV
jgi:CheY-like chemotaxis protein